MDRRRVPAPDARDQFLLDLVRGISGTPKALSDAPQALVNFLNQNKIGTGGLGGMSAFSIGRPAAAGERTGPNPLQGDVTGRYTPGFMQKPFQAPPAPVLPPSSGVTPIIQGTRDGVTPDRTQSDEYKAQLAQYGALQKAGEFAKATELGREIWKDKYKDTPMAREGGAIGTDNPLMRSTFPEKYAPQAFGVPQGLDVSQGFSIGANAVPAPWNTQGAAVSAPYQQAMQQAAEKTTGEGMPDFSTTIGAQVAEALGRPEYARFLGKK